MGKPRIAVENLFDTVVQYPDHTLTANEETTGFEVERIANGRRASGDYWTPQTANAQATITVTCDRVRAADFFRLDRGHNLAAETITLAASNDNFTTSETVFSLAVPSFTTAGALSNGLGVVTEEGAWAIDFGVRAAKYWRLTIAAMGAGLKPQVVGAWLGLGYTFEDPTLPHAVGGTRLISAVIETDGGWIGRGTPTVREEWSLNLLLDSYVAHDVVRQHTDLYELGLPAWITRDSDRGDRTILGIRPPNATFAWAIKRGYAYPQTTLPVMETAPKRVL